MGETADRNLDLRRVTQRVRDTGRTVLREGGYALVGLGAEALALLHRAREAPEALRAARSQAAERRRELADRGRDLLERAQQGVEHLSDRGRETVESVTARRRTPGGVWEDQPGGDLESLTVEELRERAREADVPGRSQMTKDELIAALREGSSAHSA